MKKIVPFKKQVLFKTTISEITSISLENTLSVVGDNSIEGNFIVSGEYTLSDSSKTVESFKLEIPCVINMDDRYVLDNVDIDIDDFYYEIVNSNSIEVNIDVKLDNIKEELIINEIPIKEVILEEYEKDLEEERKDKNMEEIIEENKAEEVIDKKEEITTVETPIVDNKNAELQKNKESNNERCIEDENYVGSIFNSLDKKEEYNTYRVYIVRENDTLEDILRKYKITTEELEKYNDIKEINIGDKLIIPYILNEENK